MVQKASSEFSVRATPPVEVKPVFGAKGSATSEKFTVFSGAILAKSGGKNYKNTSIFFPKKGVKMRVKKSAKIPSS